MKQEKSERIRGYLLGVVSVVILFQLVFLINLKQENNWGEHYRCYYTNPDTECGKTRFCSTHVPEERCYELKGRWTVETREAEMIERIYFENFDNSNIPKIVADEYFNYDVKDFCSSAQYGCVLHDKSDYESHGLEFNSFQLDKSMERCARLFCDG